MLFSYELYENLILKIRMWEDNILMCFMSSVNVHMKPINKTVDSKSYR